MVSRCQGQVRDGRARVAGVEARKLYDPADQQRKEKQPLSLNYTHSLQVGDTQDKAYRVQDV